MKRIMSLLTVCVSGSAAMGAQPAGDPPGAKTYELRATPKTVVWGYYDAASTPVLKIKSGDSVKVHTLITSSPERLESAFVPAGEVEQALRDIFNEVKDKGPGG